MWTLKILVSVSFTMWVVSLALIGCSAPPTPKYQKYQQSVKKKSLHVTQARSLPPLKRADYYASHPEGSEADYHFRLGEAYLARGQMQEAFQEFQKTVQLNLYHQEALLYLAYFIAKGDDDARLRVIVRRIRQRNPNNPALHYILATRSLRRGDLNKAERELKTALRRDPSSVILRVLLSAVYQRRGDYERAAAGLRTVLAQKPENRVVRLELAHCYWLGNQREKSLEQFDRCLKLCPQSVELRLHLASMFRQAGLRDRALSLCKEAQRLAPHHNAVLIETARTHLMKGNADAALTCLEKVKKQSEGIVAPEFRQLLSNAYLDKGDTDRAEAEVKEGLQQAPHHTALRLQLASVHLAQKRYTDAIAQYQQVLKAKPDSFTVQFLLAQAYELSGDRAQAIDAYRRALSLQPHSHVALNNLAYLYAQSGTNLDEALQLAQQAHKRAPLQPIALDTLGYVHYQRKEFDEALKYLTQAKKLSGGSPTATRLYHLALVHHQRGMKGAAISALAQALKRNPSPQEALEMQRLLEELKRDSN